MKKRDYDDTAAAAQWCVKAKVALEAIRGDGPSM